MPEFATYPSLKGRSVFVSGGGSGIGASIVEHLATQGAKVAFVDINEPASKEVAAKTSALMRLFLALMFMLVSSVLIDRAA